LIDTHTEFNKYADRRMRDEFKELHKVAIRWGDEKRESCAPQPPKSNGGKIIDQTPMGASQSGAPTPPAPTDVEVMGLCIAKLRPIEQIVFECEYAWCFGWDKAQKLSWIKNQRKIRMSKPQYNHKLALCRERVLIAYEILF
jgi:hypothetical protein